MQAQDITVTITIFRPITLILPRTITDATDPQLVDEALDGWYELAKQAAGTLHYSRHALTTIAVALQGSGSVCLRYKHDGEVTARVIYPTSLTLTNDRHICVHGFDTLRGEPRSFRLDRMACVHPVTFPGEVAA